MTHTTNDALETWKKRYAPLDINLYTASELQECLSQIPLKSLPMILSSFVNTRSLVHYTRHAVEQYPEKSFHHIKELISWLIHYNGAIDCDGIDALHFTPAQKQRMQFKERNRLWRSSNNRQTSNYAAIVLLDVPFKIDANDIKDVEEIRYLERALLENKIPEKNKVYYAHLIANICRNGAKGQLSAGIEPSSFVLESWKKFASWDDWVKSFFYENENAYTYLTPFHDGGINHILRMDYIVQHLNNEEQGKGDILKGLFLSKNFEAHAVPAYDKLSDDDKKYYASLGQHLLEVDEIPLTL